MRIAEILVETIDPEQIAAIGQISDINQAKSAALDLIFNNARAMERRADLRQQVQSAGTTKQLMQILWSMKLSNDGIPTGISTTKGKKGLIYPKK